MASPTLPPGVDDTPVFRVANRLHSAAIHLLRRVRVVDRETGLSPERLSILSVLAFAGPKTVNELAEAEQVSPPAISRILNGLETEGFVTRTRLAADRRYVRVRSTAKGRRVMDRARARRLSEMATQLEQLDDEQIAALSAAIDVLELIERERTA